jgi:hypothetical protein
MAGHQ